MWTHKCTWLHTSTWLHVIPTHTRDTIHTMIPTHTRDNTHTHDPSTFTWLHTSTRYHTIFKPCLITGQSQQPRAHGQRSCDCRKYMQCDDLSPSDACQQRGDSNKWSPIQSRVGMGTSSRHAHTYTHRACQHMYLQLLHHNSLGLKHHYLRWWCCNHINTPEINEITSNLWTNTNKPKTKHNKSNIKNFAKEELWSDWENDACSVLVRRWVQAKGMWCWWWSVDMLWWWWWPLTLIPPLRPASNPCTDHMTI